MGKKILKTKEPIKIRFKKLANGSKSVYLDYYQDGKRQYHFLKLYLNPQKDPITKAENEKVLEIAKRVKAKIYLQLCDNKGDLKSNFKKDKSLLLDYIKEIADSKKESTSKIYMNVFVWLKRYDPQMLLAKVDKCFCLGFIAYLQKKDLSNNTIRDYIDKFKACLNVAKRQKKIKENPFDEFLREEMPQREATERAYLTEAEIKDFTKTSISEDVKNAYLFSCFTGLRFGDIVGLEWGEIVQENGRTYITKRMQKTRQFIKVSLSVSAIKLLPQQRGGTNKVFELPSISTIDRQLKKSAKQMGINKRLSFHTARHTFATLSITKGADLYHISKLLGHQNMNTTQIYAKIIDQKKDEAVDLLNGII
mgnify:CR=1 FL=1